MTKSERLDLRLTAEQKSLIEQAAAIEGTTAAGFTVAAVMERAAEAVYRAKTLTLPDQAWEEFVRVLDTTDGTPAAVRRLLAEPSILER